MRKCVECGMKKDLVEDFWKSPKGKRICNTCWEIKYECETPADIPEHVRRAKSLAAKERSLKTKYDLTLDEYRSIVLKQKYRCAICLEIYDLVVDHDHETGVVRELLCSLCNSALGMLKDNPVNAERAAEYLRKHGK